ncbi:MaoC family dehydratase [Aureibacter tunicatorum]|uniref:Acyl dehydratase n=1 Tax=Aureibacter tunicatorum TaxID=866807 RepID=A0AAE3XNT7_9BACT|nr:MaoC family dehydratase [Aureibacter tunicatorum]MDR6239295.1 acyl dehydratase [Aureibacter tunicatorum]BDD04780.1 enoyl-CoA hydratase [Aureibacter tunicatorum]
MYKVGDTYSYKFTFTQDQVNKFAEVTGDFNPLHLDAEYAANTPFKKPIVHGMLGASIFSNVLGTKFPGEGSVYLGQSLSFKRAMFVDVAYEALFEIVDINETKHIADIKVEIKNIDGRQKVHLDGIAQVMHSNLL